MVEKRRARLVPARRGEKYNKESMFLALFVRGQAKRRRPRRVGGPKLSLFFVAIPELYFPEDRSDGVYRWR